MLKDIDDCVNHTCANGGSCVDGINNYSCNCIAGYTGPRCQTGRLANSSPLLAKKLCFTRFDDVAFYAVFVESASIPAHFFFYADIDDCVNRTCDNGGSCVDGVNTYLCNCVAGYTGAHCERGDVLI